jgi:hypothetical protein
VSDTGPEAALYASPAWDTSDSAAFDRRVDHLRTPLLTGMAAGPALGFYRFFVDAAPPLPKAIINPSR